MWNSGTPILNGKIHYLTENEYLKPSLIHILMNTLILTIVTRMMSTQKPDFWLFSPMLYLPAWQESLTLVLTISRSQMWFLISSIISSTVWLLLVIFLSVLLSPGSLRSGNTTYVQPDSHVTCNIDRVEVCLSYQRIRLHHYFVILAKFRCIIISWFLDRKAIFRNFRT